MYLRKIILPTLICVFFNSNTYAVESEVKMNGGMDLQFVHYTSNGNDSQKIFSKYQKQYGIYSTGNLHLDYKLISDAGFKYGARIGLEHTFKNDRSVPIAIYLENDKYGRFEGGSEKSAGKSMRVTGYNSACTMASIWDLYVKTSPDGKRLAYVTNFCSFLDSKMRTANRVDYSRKITYFTPKFQLPGDNTLQLGISYIPDSSNVGNGDVRDMTLHTPLGASVYEFAIKNGVSYGIGHSVKFNKDASMRTSFVGEVGSPIGYDVSTDKNGEKISTRSNVKFEKLNNYVLGTEFKYLDLALSASYGNYNKSLTARNVDKFGTNTYLYALGAKYQFTEKTALSVNHFYGNHKKNIVDNTTIAAEYKISSGIKTYVQTSYYQTNGKYFDNNNKLKIDKTKGSLIIVGTNFVF